MANTVIQLKYSNVTGTPPSLNIAEPAYSNVSNKLWIDDGSGVVAIGGKYYTGLLDAATSSATGNTIVRRDTSGNFESNTITANTIVVDGYDIYDFANAAFAAANVAYETGGVIAGSYANSAFLQANSAYIHANAAYSSQNTSGIYANSAYAQANTADQRAVTSGDYANSAYTQANTATTNAATADQKAVSAGDYANSAYATANTKFDSAGGTISGDVTVSGNVQINGASGLDVGGAKITNLGEPTEAMDAATKQYVDAVAEGLHIHAGVDAATTNTLAILSGGTVTYDNGTIGVGATLTLQVGLNTIDDYTLQNGDRILVKNEVNLAHNGIYDRTSATVLTRSADYDSDAEIAGGDFVFVVNGTLYNSTGWVQIDPVNDVGTDPIGWQQFSGAGTYTAGEGLTLTGTVFSTGAASYANSAFVVANSASSQATSAYNQANTATSDAATADQKAVSAGSYANSAYTQANTATSDAATSGSYANSAYVQANSAYGQANTATLNAATADQRAVTSGSYANSAYGQANTATLNAASASSYANSAYVQANTATTNAATADQRAVTSGSYANSAFLAANTADQRAVTSGSYANSAYTQANTATVNAASAGSYANSAYGQANTATTNAATADQKAVSAGVYANSAYATANTKLNSSGGTISGNLAVTGNLIVSGNTVYVDTEIIAVQDSLIKLANNNTTDVLDIGFYGQYDNGGTKYSGLVRDASDGIFKLFAGETTDPVSNVLSYGVETRATLDANFTGGNVSGLFTAISVSDGGTGRSTFTANSVLLGNGTNGLNVVSSSTEGHVLTISSSGAPTFQHLSGGTF